MRDAWRNLRVGDRVRIVKYPTEWEEPGFFVPPMTRRLYKRLIAARRVLRIYAIDEWGRPVVGTKFRRRNGSWEYHALVIDDDSWVEVKKRRI